MDATKIVPLAMLSLSLVACFVEDDVPPGSGSPGSVPTASIGRCVIDGTADACTGAPEERRAFHPLSDGDAISIIDGAIGFGARTAGMSPGDMSDPAGEDSPRVGFVLSTAQGDELARYKGRHAFAVDENSQALTVPDVFVPVDSNRVRRGDVIVVHLGIRDRDGVDRWGEGSFVVER